MQFVQKVRMCSDVKAWSTFKVAVRTYGLVKRHGIVLDMTVAAGKGGTVRFFLMGSQLKGDRIMVKGCRSPILWSMALPALRAKPAVVCIILPVAIHALHGCAGKDRVNMTAFAGNIHMAAFEREGEPGMVDGSVPTFSHMTQFALRSKRSLMFVILFMAGETIRGNTLVNIVLVTVCAGNSGVLSAQFEVRQFMIELRRLAPAFRVMTDTALRSKTPFMLVILGMTSITILSGRLQVFHISGIDVTLGTSGQSVDSQ